MPFSGASAGTFFREGQETLYIYIYIYIYIYTYMGRASWYIFMKAGNNNFALCNTGQTKMNVKETR